MYLGWFQHLGDGINIVIAISPPQEEGEVTPYLPPSGNIVPVSIWLQTQ